MNKLILLVLLSILPANLFADMKDMSKIKTHLEFLGYDIIPDTKKSNEFKAKKKGSFSLSVIVYSNSVRVNNILGQAKKATKANLYSKLNDTNKLTSIGTFYSLTVQNKLFVLYNAKYIGEYNKKNFATFIKHWNSDMQIIYKTKLSKLF